MRKYEVRQVHVFLFFSHDSIEVLGVLAGLKDLK